MALSVASYMGRPIECWDVSTAFLYARLIGNRDTDLGGNEIFMRPPKILVETRVVDGVAMCTLPSPKAAQRIRKDEYAEAKPVWCTRWATALFEPFNSSNPL